MTNESLFSGLRVLDIAGFIAGPAVRRQYQKLNDSLTGRRNR
jgi:hypothetical protein